MYRQGNGRVGLPMHAACQSRPVTVRIAVGRACGVRSSLAPGTWPATPVRGLEVRFHHGLAGIDDPGVSISAQPASTGYPGERRFWPLRKQTPTARREKTVVPLSTTL